MTSTDRRRRVRWAWVLPIMALAVTGGLMVLAERQEVAFMAAHSGAGSGYQVPATLFAQVINGPGYFLPSPFGSLDADWVRLPGVALFWVWLGVGLDRRLRGARSTVKYSRFRRGVSHAVMLGLAMLVAAGFFRVLHMQQLFPGDAGFHNFLWNVPWGVKLHLIASGWYVGFAWSAVFVFYFGFKLLSMLREHSGTRSDQVLPSAHDPSHV